MNISQCYGTASNSWESLGGLLAHIGDTFLEIFRNWKLLAKHYPKTLRYVKKRRNSLSISFLQINVDIFQKMQRILWQ